MSSLQHPALLARAGLLALALGACGGGGAGGDTTSPPGPAASVTVTLPATTLALGDSVRATATVRDAAGAVLSGAAVTWRTNATNILRVNASSGVVTALALDTASVIATAGSAVGSARLTVRPPTAVTVGMTGETFLPPSVVLAVGGTVTFDFPPGGDGHNVIFKPQPGAPSNIQPATRSQKIPKQFTTAGEFHYDCTIHPGMSGDVLVVP